MKKIFLLKNLDLFSFVFLFFFVAFRNSEIRYIYCSKIVSYLAKFVNEHSFYRIYQFRFNSLKTKKGSIFFISHKQTNALVEKFSSLILKKSPFIRWMDENIENEASKVFLEQILANEMYEYIYFKNYCINNEGDKCKYIICLEISDFSKIFQKELISHKFKTIAIPSLRNSLMLRFLIFNFQLLKQSLKNIFKLKNLNSSRRGLEKKIAINYAFDFEDPNSNVWWLEKLDIPKKNIIYYFSEAGSKIKATDEIVTKILKKGYSVKILNKSLNKTSNLQEEFIYISFKSLTYLFLNFIHLLINSKKIVVPKWQMLQWLRLSFKTTYYSSFINQNNISVILDHTEMSSDIVGLSSRISGSKKIYYQRSDIYFPIAYFRPIHHYFFTWGELSKSIFTNYHKNNITKFINVGNIIYSYPKLKFIKNSSLEEVNKKINFENKISISVFDRSSSPISWITLDDHVLFYDKVLNIAEENKNINLLIKPKHKIRKEILGEMNIESRLNHLQKNNQLVIFNSNKSFLSSLLISDISFSLGLNSAGIQGTIYNVEAFFWDPLIFEKGPYQDLARFAGYAESFFVSCQLERIVKNIKLTIKSMKKEKFKQDKNKILLRNHYNDQEAFSRIADEVNYILKV